MHMGESASQPHPPDSSVDPIKEPTTGLVDGSDKDDLTTDVLHTDEGAALNVVEVHTAKLVLR